MNRLYTFISDNICAVAAYGATLYYLEIINVMFVLVLLFGKTISVAAGIALSLVLAMQVILLNSGSNNARIIQLFIIDIHAALSIASLASFWIYGNDINVLNLVQIAMRSIILTIELPLAVFLLAPEAAALFRTRDVSR